MKRIGEIVKVVAGQAAPKEFSNDGLPFIRAGHLKELLDGAKLESLPKVSVEVANKKRLKTIPPGTIVFAKSGMSATKNRIYITNVKAYFVSHLAGILPSSDISGSYLSRYLSWYNPTNLILDSAYPSIRLEDINNLKIPLPPLPQQKKIAAILDAADSYRQKTKALIAKYEELTQSLFLDMFGDPVTNPKKWKQLPIGDILNIKHGFAFKSEYFVEHSKYTLLTPGNYYEKGGYKHQGNKQKYYEGDIPKEYILNKDDVLVVMTEQAAGLLGSTLFVPEEGTYLHNQRLGLFEFKQDINSIFIYNVFNQKSFRKRVHMDATGTKVRHTSPTKLMKVDIGIPPLSLQNQFAERVKVIEKQKAQAEASLAQAEDLFNSLLQRAFKGELS